MRVNGEKTIPTEYSEKIKLNDFVFQHENPRAEGVMKTTNRIDLQISRLCLQDILVG